MPLPAFDLIKITTLANEFLREKLYLICNFGLRTIVNQFLTDKFDLIYNCGLRTLKT